MRVLMHRAAHLLVCGRHGHGEVQERLDSGQDDGLQRTRVCVWGMAAFMEHELQFFLHPVASLSAPPNCAHGASRLSPLIQSP